jgi:hypothetical protein
MLVTGLLRRVLPGRCTPHGSRAGANLLTARRPVWGIRKRPSQAVVASSSRIEDLSEHIGELRAIVAGMPPAPEVMAPYLAKARERAYTVTDADVDGLRAAGVSEDEIFEQTVAVAIGQGLRRFDAAMEVLG